MQNIGNIFLKCANFVILLSVIILITAVLFFITVLKPWFMIGFMFRFPFNITFTCIG